MSKSYEQDGKQAMDQGSTWIIDTGRPYVVDGPPEKGDVYKDLTAVPIEALQQARTAEFSDEAGLARVRTMAQEFLDEADVVVATEQALGSLPLRHQ